MSYSFRGMEEFPAEGARKPRVMEPIKVSIYYWDFFLTLERRLLVRSNGWDY